MRSAPTLKIWITPAASVAMLEKCALLKIALWSARARSNGAMCCISAPGTIVSVCLLRRVGIGTTAVGGSTATAPQGGRVLRAMGAARRRGRREPDVPASREHRMQDALRYRAFRHTGERRRQFV